MGNFIQGTQLRTVQQGVLVTKSWTLPASATTQTLFTVTGGLIQVNMLVGQVTTLIGSTATNLSIGLGAPTIGGTLDTDGIATATAVTSAEVGCLFTPLASSGLGGALNAIALAGSAVFPVASFLVNSATITATTSANAGAGVIKWYLEYIPLDDGASVA